MAIVFSEIFTRRLPFSDNQELTKIVVIKHSTCKMCGDKKTCKLCEFHEIEKEQTIWKNNGLDAQTKICDGLRPSLPNNLPKEIFSLVENCWCKNVKKKKKKLKKKLF